jgi:hypothetical protein
MEDTSFDKIYKICWLILAVVLVSILWMKQGNKDDRPRYQFNNQGTYVLDTYTGKTYEVN